MAKLSPEQKAILRLSLIGLQKSLARITTKYSSEGKADFVVLSNRESAKVAGLLLLVDEL